jgi:hypothetical protein
MSVGQFVFDQTSWSQSYGCTSLGKKTFARRTFGRQAQKKKVCGAKWPNEAILDVSTKYQKSAKCLSAKVFSTKRRGAIPAELQM